MREGSLGLTVCLFIVNEVLKPQSMCMQMQGTEATVWEECRECPRIAGTESGEAGWL